MSTNGEKKLKISILIPGNISDKGFMQAGYRGFSKIKDILNVDVNYISDITDTTDHVILTESIRKLALEGPDLIIAHGGQCDMPAQIVANEFPNIKFTVIQGSIQGENISSYSVRQQDSSWLAGVLAGLMTKSNVVGHISGANPKSLLLEKAAFSDGLTFANPKATFLTCMTGNLEDPGVNKDAAVAMINKNADIIYSVLNSGRTGVIEAVKESEGKVFNIGNISDWTLVDKSFIASAVADPSVAIFKAASDVLFGKWKPNDTVEIGLDHPEVVRLSMGSDVSAGVKEKITSLTVRFIEGGVSPSTHYSGKEFNPATGEFK